MSYILTTVYRGTESVDSVFKRDALDLDSEIQFASREINDESTLFERNFESRLSERDILDFDSDSLYTRDLADHADSLLVVRRILQDLHARMKNGVSYTFSVHLC